VANHSSHMIAVFWLFSKIKPIGSFSKTVNLTNKYLFKVCVYIYPHKIIFLLHVASFKNCQFILPFHNMQMILDTSSDK
jgi:hypothetical protein